MSVGAVSQLTTNLSAGSIAAGTGHALRDRVGSVVGLAFGIINAFLVIIVRMPPFVATLGTMFIAIGIAFVYNGGRRSRSTDQPDFFFLGQGYVGPVPFLFILVTIADARAPFFLKRHQAWHADVCGWGEPGCGCATWRQPPAGLLIAFIVSGLAGRPGGVLLASYSYGASALATGLDFLICALAAAYLGTAFSKAGELDIVGTVIAAMFIAASTTV